MGWNFFRGFIFRYKISRRGSSEHHALECASAEMTTKELVTEVGEEEKLLRAIEVTMTGQRPTDEEMEKFKALAEYNNLAFVDLEQRLSAYGYVPQSVDDADVTVEGSPTRGGVTKSSSGNNSFLQQRHTQQMDEGKARDASGDAHGNDVLEKVNQCVPIRQVNQCVPIRQMPVSPLRERNVEAVDPAWRVKGEFSGVAEDRDINENIAPEDVNEPERACVATPVHIGVVESDEDMDSPVTPKLAEWEISEETRQALMLDQSQRQGCEDSVIVSRAAPGRSLDVLLAENSILAGDCKKMEGVAVVHSASDESNRFSMSSDWSPPHIDVLSPNVARGAGGKNRRIEVVGSNVGSFVAGGTSNEIAETVASPVDSDPMTPRMPSLEGLGNRDSVETPRPVFTSPMERSLFDEALAGGRRSESFCSIGAGHTPPASGRVSRASRTPLEHYPRHHLAQVTDSTPDAKKMVGCWGADSTDSRRDSIGNPLGGVRELDEGFSGEDALSPGTPCTPPMLSPRHGPDAAGGVVAVDSVRSVGVDAHYVGDVLPTYSGQDDEVSSNGGDYRTPELPSPLQTGVKAGEDPILSSASLCRRRLEEADGGTNGIGSKKGAVSSGDAAAAAAAAIPTVAGVDGPLMLVSEEEYARAPNFLTLQVPRKLLNDAIHNLNTYAASRLATPSELLLTFDKIVAVINQGNFSGSLLLLVAHLKRVEVIGGTMYRIPGAIG